MLTLSSLHFDSNSDIGRRKACIVPLPGPWGGWKKIFKPRKPERGGGRVVLKMSISIVVEVTNAPKTWG